VYCSLPNACKPHTLIVQQPLQHVDEGDGAILECGRTTSGTEQNAGRIVALEQKSFPLSFTILPSEGKKPSARDLVLEGRNRVQQVEISITKSEATRPVGAWPLLPLSINNFSHLRPRALPP